MALILAVGMMLILGLLGAVVIHATTGDMSLAGRFQAEKDAFYAAERAVEYALNRDLLLSMGSGVDLTTGAHPANIIAGGKGALTSGTVTDKGPGELPVRLAAAYGTDFGANYYDVSVTTQASGKEVRIDTQIVRLFKLDDDSIFMTTGSGQ